MCVQFRSPTVVIRLLAGRPLKALVMHPKKCGNRQENDDQHEIGLLGFADAAPSWPSDNIPNLIG